MVYLKCPIHNVNIYPLRYNKVENGKTHSYNINLYYCEECKKPLRLKVILEEEKIE